MAITAETVQIIVDAEVSRALKDLRKTNKTSDSLFKSFKKLAGPAAIGALVVGAVKIGNEFSKLASNAEEVNSKFSAVFKDQTQAVDRWAKEFSDDIGRSVVDTKAFLSTIQDTFVPLGFARDAAADMSKEIVTLATDLSSFNNLPTETVVRDLQSALVGNTETLRKYGVVANETAIKQEALSSGVWDGEKAITAQEKAQAILNLTLKGTVDAQGDALRTAESSANVTRRLESAYKDFGTVVGQTINTAFTPLKSALAGLLTTATEYLTKQQEINDIQDSLGDGTEILSKNLEAVQTVLSKEVKTLNEMTAFMGNAAENTGELDAETRSLLEAQREIVRKLAEHATGLQAELAAIEATTEGEKEQTFTTHKLSEETDDLVESINDNIAAEEERLRIQGEVTQAFRDEIGALDGIAKAQENVDRLLEAGASLNKKKAEEEAETIAELKKEWESYASIVGGVLTDVGGIFSTVNNNQIQAIQAQIDAAEKQGDSTESLERKKADILAKNWKTEKAFALSKAVINTAVGVSENIGNPILAALAGVAGAAQIAAIASQEMPSFPVGGKFTTTGPQAIMVGDNASGQEEVTVTPKGGSSGREMITVVIDGEQFKGYMQKQIDNRGLRSSRGGAI